MNSGSVTSAVRESFLDFMTYVVPGGLFVLVLLFSVKQATKTNLLESLAQVLPTSLGEGWRSGVTIAALLSVSYLLGMVLIGLDEFAEGLDEWFYKCEKVKNCKWWWFHKLFGERAPDNAGPAAGFSLAKLKEYAADKWGWEQGSDPDDEALWGLLTALVDARSARCALWISRYSGLANFCGATAWTALFGSLVALALACDGPRFGETFFCLVGVPLIGLALFLVLRKEKHDFSRRSWEAIAYAAFHSVFAGDAESQE